MITLLAMFAFMLIPVWIPLVAVSLGYVSDLVRGGSRPTPSTRLPGETP